MCYCTGFMAPGQHSVLSLFNFLWANIIIVRCPILLISTLLITIDLNTLPYPHVWCHWHWCPFASFSLGLSVFVICELHIYILFTYIINKACTLYYICNFCAP